jgi:hypothetical protein
MTALWEQVNRRIAALPEKDQDGLAALILEELDADAAWDETLRRSEEPLARLAAEALAEHRGGRTLPLDPETL